MIRKTLIVALTDKEEGSFEYDVLRMMRGPTDDSVIVEPVNPGRLVIQKKDLQDAVNELEKFYADTPKAAPVSDAAPASDAAPLITFEYTDDEV